MAAYTKQTVNIGTVPNDDTGDDLRVSFDKLNDNHDEIFGAITFDAGGANALTFDAAGNAVFSGDISTSTGAITVGTDSAQKLGFAKTMTLVNAAPTITIGDTGVASNKFISVTNFEFAIGQMLNDGTGAREDLKLDTSGIAIFGNDVDPAVTEMQDLGSVTFEWDNIFLQNAPTVSDKRKKNDLGSAASLVPLMKNLDPRIFSRKSKVVKSKKPPETLQRQKMEIVQEQKIEIIDGVPMVKTVDVQKPVIKMVTVKDENGTSIKKDGKVVKYPVPVMVDYTVPAEDQIVVSHGRPHTGFMAQDVKQAMTDAGIEDWAGYAYHNDEGEDTHVLRLLEFIAPILAYTQELEARIKTLEGV